MTPERVLQRLGRAIHAGRVPGLERATVDRWPDQGGRLVVIVERMALEIEAIPLGYVPAEEGEDDA